MEHCYDTANCQLTTVTDSDLKLYITDDDIDDKDNNTFNGPSSTQPK